MGQLAAPTNADRTLLPVPLLKPVADASSESTGQVHGCAVSNDGGSWQMDWQALEIAVHDFNSGKRVSGSNGANVNGGSKQQRRVCALLLCSPHNPTGHTFSVADLRQLGEFCARHDLILCSDEIHAGPLVPQTPIQTPKICHGFIGVASDVQVSMIVAFDNL